MNELFPIESDHPLFRYFTDAERERIERTGELRRIEANDFLIRAGDTDATLFAIEAGHLDIVTPTLSVIATVGAGDVLGARTVVKRLNLASRRVVSPARFTNHKVTVR
jgi:CRP-like cAMP-binding protein